MTSSRHIALGLLSLSVGILGACRSAPDYGRSDLYYGFALIDPDEEEVVENAYVVVADGRIAEIGAGEPPQGDFNARHDLSGRYGLPGFVDAHAHITAGPITIDVVDGKSVFKMESVDEITQFTGRMALAFGVTTVRNPAGDPVANARYDEQIASGTWIGPDAVHAGAVVQPPPFGGNAFVYPQTEDEWRAEAERQADLGMKYFKLYVSLTEDELATGIRVAHDQGLRAIAHLDQVSWTRAAELGIDDLTHALPTSPDLLAPGPREVYMAGRGPDSKFMYRWFELVDYDGPLMQSLIELLVQRQIRVDLTLIVNEIVYNADDLDRVWPVDAHRYAHPTLLEASQRQLQASMAGWTEDDYARARAVMPKVLELARRLHQAGVPMLLGTDAGGGTQWYARELELHAEAGIPVWDVLRLSTSQGARLLDLSERTGRFEVGLEADMVFLNSDPLEDITNVKDVYLVVTNGNAHSFEELVGDVAETAN